MKQKYLGVSILVISVIVILMLFWFNDSLVEQNLSLCETTCISQGGISCGIEACPFNQVHNEKEIFLYFIGILVAFLGGIGFYLSLTKTEQVIEQKKYDISKLNGEEKKVFLFIRENKDKGTYQSNIVEHFNFPKSKVSRILDKLESNELIERKRRGMTNIIFLK